MRDAYYTVIADGSRSPEGMGDARETRLTMERRPDFPDGRELNGLAEGSYPYRYTTVGRAHVPRRDALRIRPARRAKGTRRLVGRGGERRRR